MLLVSNKQSLVLLLLFLSPLMLKADHPENSRTSNDSDTRKACSLSYTLSKMQHHNQAPFEHPTRLEIETWSERLLPGLLQAKSYTHWPVSTRVDPWATLSKMGEGNCGDCVTYMFDSMTHLFGNSNVSVVTNGSQLIGNYHLGGGHTFFAVQSFQNKQKSDRLIVDYSWTQWFAHQNQKRNTLPPNIKDDLPLIFVGTYDELKSTFDTHREWLRYSFDDASLLTYDEVLFLLYDIDTLGNIRKRAKMQLDAIQRNANVQFEAMTQKKKTIESCSNREIWSALIELSSQKKVAVEVSYRLISVFETQTLKGILTQPDPMQCDRFEINGKTFEANDFDSIRVISDQE